MLPAASWQRLMNNLPRHHGSDASLDPATAFRIIAVEEEGGPMEEIDIRVLAGRHQ